MLFLFSFSLISLFNLYICRVYTYKYIQYVLYIKYIYICIYADIYIYIYKYIYIYIYIYKGIYNFQGQYQHFVSTKMINKDIQI